MLSTYARHPQLTRLCEMLGRAAPTLLSSTIEMFFNKCAKHFCCVMPWNALAL